MNLRRASPSVIRRQRETAEALRRQLASIDGSDRQPYFQALDATTQDYRTTTDRSSMVADLTASDLIYLSDFHALPQCRETAVELLRELVADGRPHLLGVEFLFSRQQRLLDRRQRGELGDDAFLRRVHYADDWGYPWASYRALLDAARDHGVKVVALDAPPRRGYADLRRRDEHAARRIVESLRAHSGARMMVLFGESHLAAEHLPNRVRRRLEALGRRCRTRVVIQNPDGIYWKLVERGHSPDSVVRVDASTWALPSTGPLEKYEAYRSVVQGWVDDPFDSDEVDLTPSVHHLIDVLCEWIGVRPRARRVQHRVGWSDELADSYPEVYGGREARALLPEILAENGRTPEEMTEAEARLARRGALFDRRSNTVFLDSYRSAAAAAVAARFLRAALTGRLFLFNDDFEHDRAAAAYGAAYSEALALLGARLIDPAVRYPAAHLPEPDARTAELLRQHRDFEGTDRIPPEEFRRVLIDSRPFRRYLAFELGRRLGRRLFDDVARGRLGRSDLRRLFTRPLRPDGATRTVLELMRPTRTGSYPG